MEFPEISPREAALREALLKSNQAIEDWIRCHAPEFCKPEHVIETRDRIKEHGGVLAYLAQLYEENLEILLASQEGLQEKIAQKGR